MVVVLLNGFSLVAERVYHATVYEVLRRVLPRDVRRGENLSVRLFVFLFVCVFYGGGRSPLRCVRQEVVRYVSC